MHLTLKSKTTKPPRYNILQQQERFDDFIEGYNHDRPHSGLNRLYAAEVYTRSARPFFYHETPDYPFHERVIRVTQCGRICIGRRKIHFSTMFAGQYLGVREIADEVWLVRFMEYDLGLFDRSVNRVEPVGDNPFAQKVLPISWE